MPDWNFKDNLTLGTNRYLKVSGNDIIGINTAGNLDIKAPTSSNLYISSGNTILNSQYVMLNSKLLLGTLVTTGTHILTFSSASSTGLTSNSYPLEFFGSLNRSGPSLILSGSDTGISSGKAVLSGWSTGGSVELLTNNLKRVETFPTGITNFTPNGSTVVLSVSDQTTEVTNTLLLSSTTDSTSSTTGGLVVSGGVGIKGDIFIDGGLFLNAVSGNINFTSSETSTSYSTGSTYFFGGVGIISPQNSWSETAGGALSVAGGFALGKDAYIGGKITVLSTSSSTFNGPVNNSQTVIRKDSGNHLLLSPNTTNSETSIVFYSQNNYSTVGSWKIGQNVYSTSGSLWVTPLLEFKSNNRLNFPEGLHLGDLWAFESTGGNLLLKNGVTTVLSGNSTGALTITNTVLTGATVQNTVLTGLTITNSILTNPTVDNLTVDDLVVTTIDTDYFYSNGILITNGTIGIGTSSPSVEFDNRLNSYLQNVVGVSTTFSNLFVSSGSVLVNTTNNNSRLVTGVTKSNYSLSLFAKTSGNMVSGSYLNTSGNTRGFVIDLEPNVTFDTNDSYSFNTNSQTRLRIHTSGHIQITETQNSLSNSSGALVVDGGVGVIKDVYVGGTIFTSSDSRLKTNFKPITDATTKIKQLDPVSFQLKKEKSGRRYLGFRAEDFLETFPEAIGAVGTDLTLSYDRVTAINTACIQEILKRLEKLEQL